MDSIVDPLRSVLVAQVRKAEASHCMDTTTGLLRGRHFQGPKSTVYLGDVAQAVLAHLTLPETPRFTEPPGYNEQRWTLETQSGELSVQIESKPYWGLGLITSGYLNVIALEGPLEDRSRIVLDVMSSLGQPPWEMAHPRGAERFMMRRDGMNLKANETAWTALRNNAKTSLSERIQAYVQRRDETVSAIQDDEATVGWLNAIEEDIHMAKQALSEDNAPGVERALARVEASLIHLNQKGEHPVASAPAERFAVTGPVSELGGSSKPSDTPAASLLAPDDDVPFLDLAANADEEE